MDPRSHFSPVPTRLRRAYDSDRNRISHWRAGWGLIPGLLNLRLLLDLEVTRASISDSWIEIAISGSAQTKVEASAVTRALLRITLARRGHAVKELDLLAARSGTVNKVRVSTGNAVKTRISNRLGQVVIDGCRRRDVGYAKGLAGAMSIVPQGATWVEDANMRAAATVTPLSGAPYRDFSLVLHKSLNMRWADGRPVENMASEGFGIPADPKDNSGMAVNYKSEPLWYRFAKAPDAPFGRAQGHGWGDVANAHQAYSNALVAGDPETPILKVKPGQPLRTHVTMPSGGSRGITFQLDGHVWAFNPFLSEKLDIWGYPQKYSGIGSTRFGLNPSALYIGAQESVLPAAHFSLMLPSAGGANAVPGDYLYRDYAAFGNVGGIWGLLRVSDEP